MNSDFDRHNPYAAPSEVALPEPRALTRAEAIRILRPPAIGLLVSISISLVWGCFIVADSIRNGDFSQSAGTYLLMAIVFLMAMGVFVGSIQVLRGKARVWPWVAIVPGLIPFRLTCLTVPCAFWLLHIMLRKDIRAALQSPAAPTRVVSPSL